MNLLITAMLCGLLFNFEAPEMELEPIDETETEYTGEYTQRDFEVLSHIISAEAGNCEWDMMLYVGSVVLNRVESEKFPNTIEEVVFQAGQYSPTINGVYYNTPTEGAIEVTEYLLENGSQTPENVLYQANFPQGNGTWMTLSTSYSTMYFCYG